MNTDVSEITGRTMRLSRLGLLVFSFWGCMAMSLHAYADDNIRVTPFSAETKSFDIPVVQSVTVSRAPKAEVVQKGCLSCWSLELIEVSPEPGTTIAPGQIQDRFRVTYKIHWNGPVESLNIGFALVIAGRYDPSTMDSLILRTYHKTYQESDPQIVEVSLPQESFELVPDDRELTLWVPDVSMDGAENHLVARYSVGSYGQNSGSLSLTLNPDAAIAAGAQWCVDGGSWKNSGDVVDGLTVGEHAVSFKSISGWTKPEDMTVSIVDGQTTYKSATYTVSSPTTGAICITLEPPEAVAAGAAWCVNGGPWRSSGDTVTGVPPGQYEISCKPVPGWIAPQNTLMTVYAGLTTPNTGTYSKPPTPQATMDLAPDQFSIISDGPLYTGTEYHCGFSFKDLLRGEPHGSWPIMCTVTDTATGISLFGDHVDLAWDGNGSTQFVLSFSTPGLHSLSLAVNTYWGLVPPEPETNYANNTKQFTVYVYSPDDRPSVVIDPSSLQVPSSAGTAFIDLENPGVFPIDFALELEPPVAWIRIIGDGIGAIAPHSRTRVAFEYRESIYSTLRQIECVVYAAGTEQRVPIVQEPGMGEVVRIEIDQSDLLEAVANDPWQLALKATDLADPYALSYQYRMRLRAVDDHGRTVTSYDGMAVLQKENYHVNGSSGPLWQVGVSFYDGEGIVDFVLPNSQVMNTPFEVSNASSLEGRTFTTESMFRIADQVVGDDLPTFVRRKDNWPFANTSSICETAEDLLVDYNEDLFLNLFSDVGLPAVLAFPGLCKVESQIHSVEGLCYGMAASAIAFKNLPAAERPFTGILHDWSNTYDYERNDYGDDALVPILDYQRRQVAHKWLSSHGIMRRSHAEGNYTTFWRLRDRLSNGQPALLSLFDGDNAHSSVVTHLERYDDVWYAYNWEVNDVDTFYQNLKLCPRFYNIDTHRRTADFTYFAFDRAEERASSVIPWSATQKVGTNAPSLVSGGDSDYIMVSVQSVTGQPLAGDVYIKDADGNASGVQAGEVREQFPGSEVDAAVWPMGVDIYVPLSSGVTGAIDEVEGTLITLLTVRPGDARWHAMVYEKFPEGIGNVNLVLGVDGAPELYEVGSNSRIVPDQEEEGTLPTCALSISINGQGAVTPASGQYSLPYDDDVWVEATPSAGWSFSHWEGDANGNDNPMLVIADGDMSITAVFTRNTPDGGNDTGPSPGGCSGVTGSSAYGKSISSQAGDMLVLALTFLLLSLVSKRFGTRSKYGRS